MRQGVIALTFVLLFFGVDGGSVIRPAYGPPAEKVLSKDDIETLGWMVGP